MVALPEKHPLVYSTPVVVLFYFGNTLLCLASGCKQAIHTGILVYIIYASFVPKGIFHTAREL